MTPDEIAKLIPPDVVEAVARALCRQDGRIPDAVVGPDGLRGFLSWESYKLSARSAIAAALAAWPGVWTSDSVGNGSLILPLQETQNDQG
jgi:hypothetical protein